MVENAQVEITHTRRHSRGAGRRVLVRRQRSQRRRLAGQGAGYICVPAAAGPPIQTVRRSLLGRIRRRTRLRPPPAPTATEPLLRTPPAARLQTTRLRLHRLRPSRPPATCRRRPQTRRARGRTRRNRPPARAQTIPARSKLLTAPLPMQAKPARQTPSRRSPPRWIPRL